MDETPQHYSKRKPRRCPACGSGQVVRIQYGLPSPEDLADQEAGRIELGGCVVTGTGPSWHCRSCGAQIHRESLRGRLAREPNDLF